MFRRTVYLLGLFLLPTLNALAEGVIRVGGDHNYPPYEFLNDEGLPDGYNTELTKAIAEVMGMEVEIELGRWDDMRKRLSEGEVDTLQGMVFSEERSKSFAFSPAHALIHQSIFARKGSPKASSLVELDGYEVIVQRGGIMHDYLLKNRVGATLVLVDTHASALRLLASGQHDFALVANLPGLYLGRELELSNIVPVGKPFGAQSYGYSVVKDNTELLAQFSEGLAILKNTGRQQEIYDKWLGPLEQSGLPWKKIGQVTLWASLLLLFVLGASVVWNRMLTRQVTRRTEELKLQQQQLIQADKMTSLGILVSGVAHEINNPSSLLLLNLPVLQEVYQDADEILEAHYQEHGDFYLGGLAYSRMREEIPPMLDDMLTGTQRIRRIVDDLRDFARQSPSELSEKVDLNEVLETAIRLVDNTIKQSCDHFKVEYARSLPLFLGNAQRIEQVMINLIVNACQALERPSQAIHVRTFTLDEKIYLEVIDEGRGIEPENLARLSDPFFTTRREEGGTGLGLSVSNSIVQEHGGRMLYESEPGEGTRVRLIFNSTLRNEFDEK
ncbi:transporter substrate-binding domain-containing protein [Neptuniibacter caesariensis]|uniref:histidine kinase n=1 Tax=Neptuniibacter caesariensis TaxID=207954 RepID=A0A7U8GPR0_NEPCE|nr:transporter substrate-binding domain-containing protein [Neptuniibacter caesariensis]EAR59577.1 periplasmic substrate-binding protein/sensor histidine kinase [Oceanospirillum sp. MED92] [Neptuniibacter caesariensis]